MEPFQFMTPFQSSPESSVRLDRGQDNPTICPPDLLDLPTWGSHTRQATSFISSAHCREKPPPALTPPRAPSSSAPARERCSAVTWERLQQVQGNCEAERVQGGKGLRVSSFHCRLPTPLRTRNAIAHITGHHAHCMAVHACVPGDRGVDPPHGR